MQKDLCDLLEKGLWRSTRPYQVSATEVGLRLEYWVCREEEKGKDLQTAYLLPWPE